MSVLKETIGQIYVLALFQHKGLDYEALLPPLNLFGVIFCPVVHGRRNISRNVAIGMVAIWLSWLHFDYT